MNDVRGIGRLLGFALGVLLLAWPAAGQNANVTVDDQPTAEQRLEEVLSLRRASRYDEASELLQELIEEARFKLVGIGEGGYADAEQWSRDLLLRDGPLREAYRQRYTATATRALAQAQASSARAADLAEVYRVYAVTRPGLEAGLDAAGLLLASGDPASAARLIESLSGHPDLDDVAERVEYLRGAASAYVEDDAGLAAAMGELVAMGQPELAASLGRLAESIQPGFAPVRAGAVDMGPRPTQIESPLWDQPLTDVEGAARWQLGDASVMPVVTPAYAIVNNGRQVVALDRASGQRTWAHPRDDEDVVVKPTYGQRWQDQRAVAVDEGLIAAVLGECHGITENRNPYVPPNRLVCIDEQTGQVRWTRSSGRFLDNEPTRSPDRRAGGVNLQLTHFVGTPVIHRGVVYALLRRTKSEGDTHSVWLMAYDAGDSSLLWYRHLSLVSLSYTNRDSYRVCPQMILHGDTLYLTDSLATVAAIDPHIGAYHWLRVLPVGSGDRKTLVAKTKGLIAPPVMTEAGLLVSLSNSKDRLVLIDPADGSMLRSFREDPQLSAAEYLIAAAGGALVVSPTSVSYWDEKEAAVGWTATLSPGETVVARGDASLRYAVLPTNQRLLVLDRATGDVLDSAPALTGNLVVREGEMLALSDRRVHAYTNWERVYDRLIQHIEERPTDPSAGLSLASIAMRQDGRSDSVLKGVGHALEAIERQPPARVGAIRERVFEQLRELTMQAKAPALRRSLYASLALVTQTAAQEATYHLDAGLYFAEIGETQRAVDHLHAVVAEPAFAAVAYEFDGADRSASAIAQRTIQSLIDRFGRGVYAQQDAMAEAAFATLQSDGQPDPVALTAVARRYPLSPVAGRVMLEAARARVDQGRLIDAASLFKQAIDLANDQTQRDRAAGALLSFYLQTQRPDRAGDLLDRLEARYPGLMPMADEQPLSSVEWRERIDAVEPLRRTLAPIAGAMTTPVLLPGRLVGDAPGVETMHERKRLYLHHDSGIIAAHGLGDPLQPSWTAASPVETKELLLLADSDGQVLFWSVDRGVVFAMDRSTGERIWSTTVRFDEPGNDRPLDDRRASGGTGWLIAVSETVLCIGERGTARLLAIDRASGNVTWRVALDMTAMTGLDADGWTVAAVGLGGLPQQVRSGRLSLLLLTDAEPQLEQGDVRLGVSPFAVDLRRGEATVLGSSGVASIDTRTGNTLWSKRFLNHQLSGAHALSDDLIAAETTDGHIHLLDRRSQGQTLGKTAVRSAGDRRSIDLHAADGRFWVRSGRGVFCLDEEPIVQWRDAVQTPRQVSQRLLVGRDVVAVLAQPNPAPVPNGASLLLFEQEGGRLLQQYTLGPFENPLTLERAIPWGTGLVIPSTNQTLFVPGSNE